MWTSVPLRAGFGYRLQTPGPLSRIRCSSQAPGLSPVYAQPVDDAPEHFYTQDLQWDQESTHTNDNDSFMPLNRLAECVANGKIGSASPRFYGVMTDYSQGKTLKKSAPRVLEFCKEDGVDAVILPAL